VAERLRHEGDAGTPDTVSAMGAVNTVNTVNTYGRSPYTRYRLESSSVTIHSVHFEHDKCSLNGLIGASPRQETLVGEARSGSMQSMQSRLQLGGWMVCINLFPGWTGRGWQTVPSPPAVPETPGVPPVSRANCRAGAAHAVTRDDYVVTRNSVHTCTQQRMHACI
jgi:hypothetical protein